MFGRALLPISALVTLGTPLHAEDEEWIWSEEILFPEQCSDWDEWDKPADPFRVYGSTYYVGTCGITVLAINTDDGVILIDSGTETGAGVVQRNLSRSGFRIEDVKLLLMSHEHHDHIGGMAKLQQASGAELFASAEAVPAMLTGKAQPNDPQFGLNDPFPAARVDGEIVPGEPVKLGTVALTPIRTIGHTPGALSWQWRTCEGGLCRTIVYADSLTPISNDSYRFSDHPGYVDAFRAGLRELSELDCDILLTPHPSASGMRDKLLADDLTSGMNCREYAEAIGQRLDARLAEEAAAAQ